MEETALPPCLSPWYTNPALYHANRRYPHASKLPPTSLILPPRLPQTSLLTISSTRTPIASDDVNPGLSMPSNERNPGRGWEIEKSSACAFRGESLGRIPESAGGRGVS